MKTHESFIMEKKQKNPKEKRRNMERRKEKSRDAARCRRSKETEIFTDLSSMLPLSKNDSVSHLDKASIIRIAISYLKIRTIVQSIPIGLQEHDKWIERTDTDSLFQNALEGFLLVTTTDGDIVFISDNVQRYLGLSQVDLLGQSIYELSHPCDHVEIREMLSTKDRNSQKSYFLRMKCTLTNKGRNVNIKSASYKVIQFTGRIIESHDELCFDNLRKEHIGTTEDDSSDESSKSDELQSNKVKVPSGPSYHFIAVGEPISHPANIEIPLGQNTFLTKHSLDLKFSYADEKISDFFGYNPDDLLENSIFDYHHAEDSVALRECFKNLFPKGQTQTERYRFLASGGGYAWVLTQATVIYTAAQKPHSVVCVNFVISGVENQHEVYSLCQIEKDRDATSGATATGTVQSKDDEKLTDISERYAYESSPQRLLEKLTINTSVSTTSVDETENTIAVHCDNSTDRNNGKFPLKKTPDHPNTSVEEFPSVENKKPSQSLRQVQLLSVSDFLVPCSSSSSSSSSSSTNTTNSRLHLNDNWLMTTNNENSSTFKSPDSGKVLEKLNKSKFPERVCVTSKLFSSNVKTPKPATIDVFVPFTEDMNKGFLGFADNEKGLTMLKEDPEDLTHLAPTAGDVCVPLDETPIEYVLPDMLDDIILSDCNLLSVDKVEGYLSASPNSYFNYEDDLESLSRPLSPMLSQTEDCSIPSLRSDDSPLHSSGDPFLDFEGLMHSSDEIDELSSKNSLLPLPLDPDPVLPFVANDFMWGSSSEESAWSSVSSSPTSNYSSSPRVDQNSSLAKLLTANPVHNYHGQRTDTSEDRADSGTRQRTTETITSKRSTCQPEGSVNVNRSYSSNSVLNNKTTMQYQQRSSAAVNNQVDVNRRRCNLSRMTTTVNSVDSLITNAPSNGNLQNVHAVLKRDLNNRGEDKRAKNGTHSVDVVVGSKRSSSENWGRSNACKRSKQNGKTIIVNTNGSSNGVATKRMQQHHDSARTMAAAVAAAKQTNSVLMNLLVSGCDLNAGYDEDKLKQMTLHRDLDTDQDIKLIEEAVANGHFTNMNSETWMRIKKKLFNPKDLTKIPSFMEPANNDVNVPSTVDSFFSMLEYV